MKLSRASVFVGAFVGLIQPALGPAIARESFRPWTTFETVAFMQPRAHSLTQLIASFYGHGERLNAFTTSGERFNSGDLTCAHRTLPFGTKLRVTYQGHVVVVRVNDRGPASWTGRSLDLTYAAARAIGLDKAGAGPVQVAVLN